MRIFRIFIIIVLLLSVSASARSAGIIVDKGLIKGDKGDYVKGEVIVKYKKDVPDERINGLHQKVNAIKKRDIPNLRIQSVKIPDNMSIEDAIAQYKNDPDVEYAEPNYILRALLIPNDTSYNQLWGLNNTGQTVNGTTGTNDADIDAPEAWDITTGCITDVVIAVIDTGVAYNHPDLAANIWSNTGENCTTPIGDNDGNGYANDCRGWDFLDNDNDPMDYNSHGTHVAGTIAARGNNSSGITGVMWCAKIMPLRFLGVSGAGDTANAISAITYAADNGANIINASWGGGADSQALYNAINYARSQNVLFVAAAGNDGTDNDTTPSYPASYNLDNIISVAATTQTDGLASFSNYGATSVDVGAPGVNIYSSIPVYSYTTVQTLYPLNNFDSGIAGNLPSGWSRGGTNSTWALTDSASSSPSNSLTDSPSGNYANNTDSWANYTTPIASTKNYRYTINFNARYSLENNYDYLLLCGSTTGAACSILDYWTGSSSEVFTPLSSVELTVMADLYPSFYFGFGLFSDSTINNYDGVYIDDVQLIGESIAISSYSYGYMSGTSMASPHVAGVAGLVLSANPTLTYSQVRDIILNNVDIKTSLSGRVLTGGRVNAFASVSAANISAPSNLIATAVSTNQINLSWTDNSTETGFRIERSGSSGGPYTQIATVGANVTTYANTGLSASTTYYYRVRAYNANGNSASSSVASATTQSPPPSNGGGDGSGGGGCGVIDSNRDNQPPMAGMVILLLPVAWLLLRKLALKLA